MLVVHVFSRLKSFLLGILTLFRRALCCFSRRRKRSHSECEVLNSISVVQNDGNHSSTKHRNDVSACANNHRLLFQFQEQKFNLIIDCVSRSPNAIGIPGMIRHEQ